MIIPSYVYIFLEQYHLYVGTGCPILTDCIKPVVIYEFIDVFIVSLAIVPCSFEISVILTQYGDKESHN